MRKTKWDARIERARQLQSLYPFAAEGLRFYERIAGWQRTLYAELGSRLGIGGKHSLLDVFRHNLDMLALLPAFAPFLALIEQHAPAPLSVSAGQLKSQGNKQWEDALTNFWEAEPGSEPLDPAVALISWVFLQPYAEYLAELTAHFAVEGTPSRCRICSRHPQVGVLRQEGDGAKRSLVCSLGQAHEWEYRRIVCPACGEEDVKKLAVYSTEKFPQVRVEACDTCRSYIKSVDLTKDGHAVPVVDELADHSIESMGRRPRLHETAAEFAGIVAA